MAFTRPSTGSHTRSFGASSRKLPARPSGTGSPSAALGQQRTGLSGIPGATKSHRRVKGTVRRNMG